MVLVLIGVGILVIGFILFDNQICDAFLGLGVMILGVTIFVFSSMGIISTSLSEQGVYEEKLKERLALEIRYNEHDSMSDAEKELLYLDIAEFNDDLHENKWIADSFWLSGLANKKVANEIDYITKDDVIPHVAHFPPYSQKEPSAAPGIHEHSSGREAMDKSGSSSKESQQDTIITVQELQKGQFDVCVQDGGMTTHYVLPAENADEAIDTFYEKYGTDNRGVNS